MSERNPKVDTYLEVGCGRCPLGNTPNCKVHDWVPELETLRAIAISAGLTEDLKWGAPCYTFDGKNVLMISALKESATIGFFKGALIDDGSGLLAKPGENSQAVRVIKFQDVEEIGKAEAMLRDFIVQAIEIEKSGRRIEFKKNPEPIPQELQEKLDSDPIFSNAFFALSPGRQRGYILHFSQPKQAKTRLARIEKLTPKILDGKGFHDRY